jgi:hypothetical protein
MRSSDRRASAWPRRGACAVALRMISSNAAATAALRAVSPLRVAAWLSAIQASSSSSIPCQPSQAVCARTANGRPISATASTTVASRGSAATTASAIARTRGSSAAICAGAKKPSTSARHAACSGGSMPLGTARRADAADEKVCGSCAAATTSACRNSVTPRGDRASAQAVRMAVVGTQLVGKHLRVTGAPRSGSEGSCTHLRMCSGRGGSA